jgi:hypothetical protein
VGTILDSITTFKDNITGGAFETLAAASGESLAIRWLEAGTQVYLLEAWGGNNTSKMDISIRSPLMHDNVRGLRFAHMFNPTLSGADGNPQLYLAPYWRQEYNPTDTLVVEVNGTAAADVTFTQSLLYRAPGMSGGRFLSAPEVLARTRNLVGIRVSPAAEATTSTYGTAEAINTDDDRLKANTDYALLGLTTDLPFTTLGIFGPDTGNFTIPIPGHWNEQATAGWFYELARRWNEPLIPVINSNNKGVTFTKLADAGGGTAPLISLQFAELAGPGG